MTEHTKGPWTIAASGNIYGHDRRFVCWQRHPSLLPSRLDWEAHNDTGVNSPEQRHNFKAKTAENWANAHLIAAAPELYEALKHLQNEFRGCISAFDIEIRAATNVDCILHQLEKAAAAIAKAEGK